MIVSVVVPCRNESSYITLCIDAIYASILPNGYSIQVIIVDGMSDDNTLDFLEKLKEKYHCLHIVKNEQKITPFAFNLGIKLLAFDFLLIVGARQLISDNYIGKGIEILKKNNEIWCLGGKVENIYINEDSKLISNAMSSKFGMGIGNFRTLDESQYVDTIGTPMYPKFVFERIGFFDENLVRNQDDDFNYRVSKAGGKIFFSSEISLKYYVRSNFQSLWKQFYQYGYWKVYVNKKHRTITTLRQVIPALFVIFLMTFPFTFVSKPFFIMFVAILSLYLILALLTSVRVSKHLKGVLYSIFTFIILHVGYGLGYLNGIIDFALIGKRPSDKNKTLSR
jgi:glycosyltransferase involved in cell wall biosynthesis